MSSSGCGKGVGSVGGDAGIVGIVCVPELVEAVEEETDAEDAEEVKVVVGVGNAISEEACCGSGSGLACRLCGLKSVSVVDHISQLGAS